MFVALALLTLTTSALSGVLGMGGGLILMAGLLYWFPLEEAMILHGTIQLWSNGQRAIHHRPSLAWRQFFWFTAASVVTVLGLRLNAFVLNKTAITALLGLMAIAAALHGRGLWVPSYASRVGPLLSGVLVSGIQVVVGVAGPLLDLFFRRESDRHWVVGNKALTQTLSHLLKILFYGSLLFSTDGLARVELFWAGALGLVMASLGTIIGTRLLNGLSDRSFVQFSRCLLLVLGMFYVANALKEAAWLF